LSFPSGPALVAQDANLIIQIFTLCLLSAGAYYARASRFRTHGLLMKSVMIIQFGALIFWMGPSLVLNVGALATFESGPLITVLHAFIGVSALVFAVSAVFHRPIISPRLGKTMWATFVIWALSALSGFIFYVYYYLVG